jgi:hypothetical protein
MNSSNSGVKSIVRLRWRGSILIRGRHVSDKDPLGEGRPLRQQAGFENRHAGPDGGWWTVDEARRIAAIVARICRRGFRPA